MSAQGRISVHPTLQAESECLSVLIAALLYVALLSYDSIQYDLV